MRRNRVFPEPEAFSFLRVQILPELRRENDTGTQIIGKFRKIWDCRKFFCGKKHMIDQKARRESLLSR
jgi:hypothetical protein